MKRLVLAVGAAFAASAALAQAGAPAVPPASTPSSGSSVRIGVIHVERLIQESAMGKEAFSRVKKLNDLKKEELDKLSKELREMEQKLADQGSSMAEDKRDALQKQYQERAISFKRAQDDANRLLEDAQKKELAELERRVMPVITQVGKEKGFTVIFNKFQAGLVYADEHVDVTEDVLRVFNTQVAVPAAKPAESSAKAAPATAPKATPPPAAAPAPTKKPS